MHTLALLSHVCVAGDDIDLSVGMGIAARLRSVLSQQEYLHVSQDGNNPALSVRQALADTNYYTSYTAFQAVFRAQHPGPLAAGRPFPKEPPRKLEIPYCWCILHLRPLPVWKYIPESEARDGGRKKKRLPPQFVNVSQRFTESHERKKRVAAVLHTMGYCDRTWRNCVHRQFPSTFYPFVHHE